MSEKKLDKMTEQELASFYEEHKEDMSLWQKKPRRIRARRGQGPSTMFSLRMTGEELTKIALAAEARGQSVSDFIRSAAMAAIEGEVEPKSRDHEAAKEAVRKKATELAEAVGRL